MFTPRSHFKCLKSRFFLNTAQRYKPNKPSLPSHDACDTNRHIQVVFPPQCCHPSTGRCPGMRKWEREAPRPRPRPRSATPMTPLTHSERHRLHCWAPGTDHTRLSRHFLRGDNQPRPPQRPRPAPAPAGAP